MCEDVPGCRSSFLTLYVQPRISRQLPQPEGINRLVLGGAVLDLQGVDRTLGADLIFVTGLDLNTILDPLSSSHSFVGQFQAKHSILSLHHVLILHGLLYLHSCGNIHKILVMSPIVRSQLLSFWCSGLLHSLKPDLPSTLREAKVLEVATS